MAGKRILPKNITGKEKLADIIDNVFLAYNSARLKEGCQLFADKMLEPDVTIGMSISGALTPPGLGCSSIIPLIKAGFVDWIVSTGANLYHDMHFALNYPVHMRQLQIRRHRPARQRPRPHLRRGHSLQRRPDGHRRDPARHPDPAGIPEGNGHRRTALPDRQVLRRMGTQRTN